MKAVFKWLNENIDIVIHNSENDIRLKKKVTKVLSEMRHLSKSDLLTVDERSTIAKMYNVLFNRLSLP